MQRTFTSAFSCKGKGLHSGLSSQVHLEPAPTDTGIQLFVNGSALPLSPQSVSSTTLCTTLQNEAGQGIMTVEHLLAALHGMAIDNCIIHCEGAADIVEIPILDGSSQTWVDAFLANGIKEQSAERRFLSVNVPQELNLDDKKVYAKSYAGLKIEITCSFSVPGMDRMQAGFVITPDCFANEIAPARTFCMEQDIEDMRQAGLIKGGGLDCAVVFNDQGQPVNAEGLRFADEPIRHKLLDVIGDFFIFGQPVQGHFMIQNPGHGVNNQIMRALFTLSYS